MRAIVKDCDRLGPIIAFGLVLVSLMGVSGYGAEEKAKPATGAMVKGQINGIDLEMPFAYYADSRLELRTVDRRTWGPGIEIWLKFAKGEMPEGKTFVRKVDEERFDAAIGLVAFRTPKPGGKDTDNGSASGDYESEIVFGKVEDDWIEGRIKLNSPKLKISISGNFRAKIEGLRLKNGIPELTSDAFETLAYVAKLNLESELKDKITIKENAEALFSHPTSSGTQQYGQMTVQYKKESESEDRWAKFQFIKDEEWKVTRQLRMDQLYGANSEGLPRHNEAAAHRWKAIEKLLQQAHPGRGLFILDETSKYARTAGKSAWTIRYQVEGIASEKKEEFGIKDPRGLRVFENTWLLESSDHDSPEMIIGQLNPDETFDTKTGEVLRK